MSHAYPIVFALGTLAGLVWLLLIDPRLQRRGTPPDPDSAARLRVDAGLAALACGLAGARLGYLATHASYYSTHLGEALRFSDGGLSWVGGALGALAGLGATAAVRRASPWPLADALAIPAVFVAAAAWSGCLLDGCAFGRTAAWSGLSPLAPDFYLSRLPRWPTQLLGVLITTALLLGLLWLEPKAGQPGLLACAALVGLGLSGLALSFTRGDPVPLWSGIRLDALGALGIAALGIFGASLRRRPASP